MHRMRRIEEGSGAGFLTRAIPYKGIGSSPVSPSDGNRADQSVILALADLGIVRPKVVVAPDERDNCSARGFVLAILRCFLVSGHVRPSFRFVKR